MRRNSGAFLLGLVLLVAGLAALAYGYYMYSDAIGGIGKVRKFFSIKSAAETQSIILMIGGGAVALFGAFLAFFRGRR